MQNEQAKGASKLNELLVSLFHEILEIEQMAVQKAAKGGLTITEIHTLAAVGRTPGPMTAAAERLGVTVSTLTVAVNKLVAKGYAEKRKSENDRRVVEVRLSPKGEAMVEAHDRFHKRMTQAALKGLGADEAALLTKGIQNLQAFFFEEKKRCQNALRRQREKDKP